MAQRENGITEKELQELRNMLEQLETLFSTEAAAAETAPLPRTAARRRPDREVPVSIFGGELPERRSLEAGQELAEVVKLLEEIRNELKEQNADPLYYN